MPSPAQAGRLRSQRETELDKGLRLPRPIETWQLSLKQHTGSSAVLIFISLKPSEFKSKSLFSFSAGKKVLSPQITVMKFGGSSVEDGAAFKRAVQIVLSGQRAARVVVVSAMKGVTDALIRSLDRAVEGESEAAAAALEEHFERHLRVAGSLGGNALARMRVLIENTRAETSKLLRVVSASRIASARSHDTIASYGERLSASLFTILLEEYGAPAACVDARRCILTNEEHGSAEPLIEETWRQTRGELKPLIEAQKIPVLGGFIGATMNGVTTTLGRGSSDYTATLVSAALGATETQIWSDVDGVQTADPDLVRSARTVSHLSYEEAAELARLGAKVLHPKMIQPVLEQEIPIRVCNSRAPKERGTIICARTERTPRTVTAIAHKTNLTRIDITSTPAFVANGFLHAIEEICDRHHTQMDIVATSKVGISITCAEAETRPAMLSELQQVGAVEIKRQRAIISCVGDGLRRTPQSATKVLDILREIDSTLTWRSTSHINLITVVDADRLGPVLKRLHQGIFE
jgi:aspartate kinase